MKKMFGSNIFSAQFIKIISHYRNIGYNISTLQQTAYLVVNPITVGNFAFLFNCRRLVGLQTLRQFLLKNLSIDEMVGAWCFGCCQAHRGLPVGFLLRRYSVVLIFALSPFYILIYILLNKSLAWMNKNWFLFEQMA